MQRLYYSISDVAKMLDEETYVLRYWEKEFNQIAPKKNSAGKRVYSERDVDIIRVVKKLLRDDKLSIIGAKEQLAKFNFNNQSDNLYDGIIPYEKSNDDNYKKFEGEKIQQLESFRALLLKLEEIVNKI